MRGSSVVRHASLLGGVLLMATYPIHALTVYDSDDVTPLFTVSTDPGHANPYLKHFDNYPEQEVDLVKGSASIGQMSVGIVDVPTDPADQDTGWMTAQLPDAAGYSQLIGHRALATEDNGTGAETVLDGVIGHIALSDSFAGYDLELRDIRERERKTRAFTRSTTPTVWPRGVLDGYGQTISVLATTTKYPVPPTQPITAVYASIDANQGSFRIENQSQPNLVLADVQKAALQSIGPLNGDPSVYIFNRWRVRWRLTSASPSDPWNVVEQVTHSDTEPRIGSTPYAVNSQGKVWLFHVNNFVNGESLPSNGASVHLIIGYDGPPTKEWPLHIEGETVGSLLADIYDGVYSDEDPRIKYNASAVSALSTPVRMIVDEPWDDVRKGTEKELYPAGKAAPVLNPAGEIAPISWVLPDASVTLLDLTNSNCMPEGGGFDHGADDAINLVRVTYKRDFGDVNATSGDRIASREVEVEHRIQESIDLVGEQKLEIDSAALRALGTKDGLPLFGDVTDEAGAQLAAEFTRMATDRLAFGGQKFTVRGRRTDADIESALPGSWCNCGMSWMPDYVSGERGLSRLAQVIRRRNLNAAWCLLTLIDAGSVNAPLGQPTLGTVTVNTAGIVSIPVTALATGGEARVDYAVNDTEPAGGSTLWRFLDRVDSVPTTLKTPPVPPGATVWVRARSEAQGERPSTYITAVSVTANAVARIIDAEISIADDGVVTVTWSPNDDCLGIALAYEVHDVNQTPAFGSTVEVDASDQSYVFSSDPAGFGEYFSLRLTPYSGWTGSAVSGTAGPAVEVRIAGEVDLAVAAADALQALLDAAAAQSTADGKITTFIASSAPTAEGVGDLWLDSDTTLIYRWSGSAWVYTGNRDIKPRERDVAEIANPGFENGLTYWGGSPSGKISAQDTTVDAGSYSLKISPTGSRVDVYQVVDAEDADNGAATADRVLYRVKPGDRIRVRGRYRTDGALDGYVRVRWRDKDDVFVSLDSDTLPATATWTDFEYVATAPATAAYGHPILSTPTTGTGDVYFDQISLELIPWQRPEIAVKEVRSGGSSTITVDVDDPDLRVTAIEFKKREAIEGGDTLDASWQTSWDSSTGTIGADSTLQRTEACQADPGLEGEFQWRVQYTDAAGNPQTVQDSFKVVNLEEESRVLELAFADFVPAQDSYEWTFNTGGGYFTNRNGNLTPQQFVAAVVMPPGVIITDIALIAYRAGVSDAVTLQFNKVGDTDAAVTNIVSSLAHDTTGWQNKSTSISETVDGTKHYFVRVTIDPITTDTDARCRSVKISYDRPAYTYSY